MKTVVLTAWLVGLASSVGAQQGPCEAGWTYFPDLGALEYNARRPDATRRIFGGSCLRLYPRSIVSIGPSDTRSFSVLAGETCTFASAGGHLLSLNSLSTAPLGLLAALKPILAPASTLLVYTGGEQKGGLGPGFGMNEIFRWQDNDTNPAAIRTVPGNWASGQPEYVGVCERAGKGRGWG